MSRNGKRPRYGITRAQIAAAQRQWRRGDHIGACAACGIEPAVDLRDVRERAGREVAAAVEDDLAHLVPDLLRWHALGQRPYPARTDSYLRWPALSLAGYGDNALHLAAWPEQGPLLGGTARFALRFGPLPDRSLPIARETWDARHAAGLLALCGGHTRLPFFAADGRRLAPAELEGAGPESLTERVVRLFAEAQYARAWEAAGADVELGEGIPESYLRVLPTLAPAGPVAIANARRAAARAGVPAAWIRAYGRVVRLDRLGPHDRPRVRVLAGAYLRDEPAVELAYSDVSWLPDFRDLLSGRLEPGDLHPMVAAALFPTMERAADAGPPDMPAPATVRVRCEGVWHELAHRGGTLTAPHPPEAAAREAALLAFGGPPPAGCPAAQLAWRGARIRLPRALRELRGELMLRVAAGEADTLEAMLDAGLDPNCRDGDDRTVLHLLPCLIPDGAALRLLPRLLAAGVNPNALDRDGLTPLMLAERSGARPELIAALRAATAT
ncbi:hypothetical protein [Dactylosporangium salmoneum]|uniref:Ankyrin repeat domain-containing protein n=1 Tax=Dactylosporangium salmoneum TaxID=53361 RepID=A0ABP5UGB4_9ACTN